MGSPITLSGFNNIDFNVILEAIMTQERVPVDLLGSQRSGLKAQDSEYSNLATKLSSLQLAAESLATSTGFGGRAVTNTDQSTVSISATNSTPLGA